MTYFDHFASSTPTPFGHWLNQATARTEFSLINHHLSLKKNQPLLEIGPGRCHLANLFLSHGYNRYHAIEPNPTLAKQAMASSITVVSQSLVPPLKTKPHSYSAVIASNLLEHLPLPNAQTLLIHIKNTLRREGHLILLGPDYLDWQQDFWNVDYSHQFPTTVKNLTSLLADAGYSISHSSYLHGPLTGSLATLAGFTTKSLLFWSEPTRLYKIKLAFLRRYLIIATPLS